MARHSDTIAALATPAGAAALAVLRISGPDTRELAAAIAGSPPPPRIVQRTDYRDRSDIVIDDVLLTYFEGPRSYTGEDTLEISGHGNPFIVERMLADLFARGCRPAAPGEFTQRAFLNGRIDLGQAEAVMDLIHARSERALAEAHRQVRGSLGRRMSGLIEGLLSVLARIEAQIDFPEEDLPPADRDAMTQELGKLATETGRLSATRRYGDMLRHGIRTVIVGAPNVGKSSLLNRLVGQERALISAEPGTTRDCLRLIDTAGFSASPAPLESLGMAKTRDRLAEADLTLVVVDGSDPEAAISAEILSNLGADRSIIVFNKSDLSTFKPSCDGIPPKKTTVAVSALTGDGVDELTAAICSHADALQIETGSDTIAVNARHARALGEAGSGLKRAISMLEGTEPTELVANELRGTLLAFGEIVGKIDNERMLDHLFSSFCIGK